MDNFDLRKYLVENRVTRNSQMIRENEDGSWLQIVGAFGGMHSEKSMYDVVDFTGGMAEMKAAVRDLIAAGEPGNVRLTFNDSKVVAFESDNQEFIYFVKKDAFPGPVDEDFVNNIEEYVYNGGKM